MINSTIASHHSYPRLTERLKD